MKLTAEQYAKVSSFDAAQPSANYMLSYAFIKNAKVPCGSNVVFKVLDAAKADKIYNGTVVPNLKNNCAKTIYA